MRFLCLFLFLFTSVFAENDAPLQEMEILNATATDGLPNNLVNGSVCAISGTFVDFTVDLFLPGPEPLTL